jgi:hypothetical protein
MGIVEDLIANPGLYIGIDDAVARNTKGAARIVVTPLPGGASVSLDYEIFNPANVDHVRGHVEHTIVGRTHAGTTVMVIADPHSHSLQILRETQPGVFEVGDEPAPYPMKVEVSVPEPGKLRHVWSYGSPGDEPIPREITEATLAPLA